MQKIFPLTGRIQYYDWGSRNAIPKILGLKNSKNRPVAEIWYGTHSKAPSGIITEKGEESLQEVISRFPNRLLGEANVKRFGSELPFLLKIISAASPLSIQVHPDKNSARSGYEKEEKKGIPATAPDRNYRDANHKPECIYALTEFHALKGFRDYREIIGNLKKYAPKSLDETIESFSQNTCEEGMKIFLKQLLSSGPAKRLAIHSEAMERSSTAKEEDRTAAWIHRLCRLHPEDPAALAPAFLNLLQLKPGDALFLEPGEMHAYLEGTGLEVMATSDNVIRGGLTEKHVDTEELLKVTCFKPSANNIISLYTDNNLSALPAFAEEFKLSFFISETIQKEAEINSTTGPLIILNLEGEFGVSVNSDDKIQIKKGDSLFISSEAKNVFLSGKGTLAIASIPGKEDFSS